MRKIASVLVFAVALIGSWFMVHSDPSVGFETHTGIQEKLITLITNAVTSKKPQAQKFEMTRLWTETVDENKVRATFAYRFSEPADNNEWTEQSIEGEAILHREPSDDEKVDRWVIQSVKTNSDLLSFTEGSVVTPVPGEDETQGSETPAPATPPTPEKPAPTEKPAAAAKPAPTETAPQ